MEMNIVGDIPRIIVPLTLTLKEGRAINKKAKNVV